MTERNDSPGGTDALMARIMSVIFGVGQHPDTARVDPKAVVIEVTL